MNLLRIIGALLGLGLAASASFAQPAAPGGLVARVGDGSVILHWNAGDPGSTRGYRVYRATTPEGPYTEPVPTAFRDPHFVDLDAANEQAYWYRVTVENLDRIESAPSDSVEAAPGELDDEAFLDLVELTAIDYFWYEANPANGLVRDRDNENSPSSIAAVGFGLSALAAGVARGWYDRAPVRERVLTTLEFFWNSPQGPEPDATGYKGFYYHFLDMDTGRRRGTTELSTIDTALLLGGVLHMRQFFDEDDPDEARIRALADSIYERVEWDWAQVRGDRISHGWRPESGFIPFDWGGYNEAMILYLLALGSPTHPVEPTAWAAWRSSYNYTTYYGLTYVVFPPLFGHQYSHVWIDFRTYTDAYMRARDTDYFENSRRATLAQQAYAISNPMGHTGYGEFVWGLTASAGPDGYRARGVPPAQNDDGTIAPTAAGGSYPFAPEIVLPTLRHFYDAYKDRLWGRYGFRDAFNLDRDWFSREHLGIDQGPIAVMIENGRSGLIWTQTTSHPAILRGLERANFQPVEVANDPDDVPFRAARIDDVAPHPVRARAETTLRLDHPGPVRLELVDVLGRTVRTLVDEVRPVGAHRIVLERGTLPAGLYFLTVLTPTGREVRPVVFTTSP